MIMLVGIQYRVREGTVFRFPSNWTELYGCYILLASFRVNFRRVG